MRNFLLGIAAIVILGASMASAASVFLTFQGGTGTTTPAGILYGDNGATTHLNTVNVGNGLTFSGGTLSSTVIGAGAYPFTPGTNMSQQVSATSTMISDSAGFAASSTSYFTGLYNYMWAISTSTTICPDNTPTGQCQYIGGAGLQQAITDGWNDIHLKAGSFTITSPIYVPRSGFNLSGEGNSTIVRYNGNNVKVGIMTGNPGAEFTDTLFRDFQIKEDSTGGLSTCFDSSHLAIGKIERIVVNDCKFGFMASTGQSYYMTYDTDEVVHLISHNGNDPLIAVGFYLGDPSGADGGPINNTIINAIVNNFVNGSSTAYYFNSHSIKCISCDSEGGYIGVHLGPRASDFNGLLYLEANTIGLTMDASAAQVGGVNITGNISDATPNSNNIVDNGVAALCVNARVQYAGVNYCTNVKQGFGTINPTSLLEVSNEVESATPGQSGNTLGLFGGRGTAISLDFKSGSNWSGRQIVNPSVSTNFPLMDFVVSTSTAAGETMTEPLGVRFIQANTIGTGDMFIQPESSSSGYVVFEGKASTTVSNPSGAPQGTWISSFVSPVILGPNRTQRLTVDYPSGNVGVGTTTPWSAFSVMKNPTNNNPIIAVATSTSNNLIFSIFGTTSIQALLSTGAVAPITDVGVRIGVGTTNYLGFGGLLDQLVIRGRINTEGWNSIICDISSGLGTNAANSNICGAFNVGVLNIAANALSNANGGAGSGYAYASVNVPVNANASSATFYVAGETSGGAAWLSLATDTPVMEVNTRIHSPQNSTTTSYYVGYTTNVSGTVTFPTDGCFFNASSTASNGNWWAVAAKASAYTFIDTGVASSTSLTGTGGWRKFRLEGDSSHCAFYIQASQSANLTTVANITTNIPTAGVHSHIWIANTSAGLQSALDFNHYRLWWRDYLPAI